MLREEIKSLEKSQWYRWMIQIFQSKIQSLLTEKYHKLFDQGTRLSLFSVTLRRFDLDDLDRGKMSLTL